MSVFLLHISAHVKHSTLPCGGYCHTALVTQPRIVVETQEHVPDKAGKVSVFAHSKLLQKFIIQAYVRQETSA